MTLRFLLLGVLYVAGTWLVGWWCVPLISIAYALLQRTRRAPVETAVGVTLAWSVLFLMQAMNPAFSTLLKRLDGVFPAPVPVVILAMVLFAALYAWSAARVTVGITGVRD